MMYLVVAGLCLLFRGIVDIGVFDAVLQNATVVTR